MAKVLSIFDTDPREVPLYTVAQAARYLEMPSSTLRAWIAGNPYPKAHGRKGRFKEVVNVSERPTLLTFNDLAEAYVVKVLRREHEVPLSAVRRALKNLDGDRPLLTSEFATAGVKVYLREIDQGQPDGRLREISVGKGRQYAIPQVIARELRRVERADGGIMCLFPYLDDVDEPRVIAIDPRRAFGSPTIKGTRIKVDIVADLVEAGETHERVAREFSITTDAVNRAVKWHQRIAA